MIRVKLIGNWNNSRGICDEWNKMTKDDYTWNNIQLTWEDTNIDYYVILNKPNDEFYIPSKTIVFHMEPWCGNEYQNWGIKTWGDWANPDKSKFLQVRTIRDHPMVAFWQLSTTYNQFIYNLHNNIYYEKKHDKVSSICSSKYFDPGHVKRIDFIRFIETRNSNLIDVFGYENYHSFVNYKGKIVKDKEQGFEDYKYYFMSENNKEENYATEKIYEPILMECLCFYWGCPNIYNILDERTYIVLNLDDFEESYNTIIESIKNNEWLKRLPFILSEKERILNTLTLCPTVETILNEIDLKSELHL